MSDGGWVVLFGLLMFVVFSSLFALAAWHDIKHWDPERMDDEEGE